MKYLGVLFFLLVSSVVFAQLTIFPLHSKSAPNARTSKQAATTITLPFWDDFSNSSGILDTTWWLPESQVQVISNLGVGIDPPTLGVVTFDGINALGIPYQNTPSSGPVDSLVSQPIDMTQVATNLRNTVYLSFFYQTKGLGEAPEEEDSLTLYFKDLNGTWNKVWPTNANDKYNTDPSVFTQKLIQVNNVNYFHSDFQFMFKAIGRQNGWFDNWLLDYVYMDKRRSASDNSYLDKAFTAPPSSVFNQYTAIPFDDFVATLNKTDLFNSTSIKVKNLEAAAQSLYYTTNLYNLKDTSLIEVITDNYRTNIESLALLELTSNSLNPALLDTTADSLSLMLEYYVETGDTLLVDSVYYSTDTVTTYYPHIDLRQNDIIRSYVTINDYYAYDDGTAEFGAGFSQPQGKLAYQYEVVVGKYLDRVDIYFPNVDGVQSGTPLELFVLKDFDGKQNSLMRSSNIAINHTGINQFVEYKLSSPLYVTDTFFIGFTNLSSTNQWVAVGLDKNTDSFDKMYFNIDGNWVQNTNVHGSLMMRPHFIDQPLVTGIENNSQKQTTVYPNPSFGQIQLQGTYNSLRLIDLFGRDIPFKVDSNGVINYHITTQQLLIIIIETDKGNYSKRIIANPSNQ